MSLRKVAVAGRRSMRARGTLQIAFIIMIWAFGELAAKWTGLPIPGGVIGMFIALALLGSRLLSTASMRRGADWLLTEMLLFFIPVVLAVLDHKELLSLLGLKVLVVVLLGTAAVMGATALTADLMFRWCAAVKGESHGSK